MFGGFTCDCAADYIGDFCEIGKESKDILFFVCFFIYSPLNRLRFFCFLFKTFKQTPPIGNDDRGNDYDKNSCNN